MATYLIPQSFMNIPTAVWEVYIDTSTEIFQFDDTHTEYVPIPVV